MPRKKRRPPKLGPNGRPICKLCRQEKGVEPSGRVICTPCKHKAIKKACDRRPKVCDVCDSPKQQDSGGYWRCKRCLLERKREYARRVRKGELVPVETKGEETPTYMPSSIWGPNGAVAAIQRDWSERERHQRAGLVCEPVTIEQLDSAWLLPGGMEDRDVFNF